ncbi:MAG: DPP IV N-terminal domain-containing protein [Saprospiraceae bacterium]|nr:DPP IV N-terminal domain-containing protein [Saprospiraceae bacterium]
MKRLMLLGFIFFSHSLLGQNSKLDLDRIYANNEFKMERFGPSQWLDKGNAYTTLEPSLTQKKARDIIKYEIATKKRTPFVTAEQLTPKGQKPLSISSYSWSEDEQQLLIFTNTARVWRANTRGDYWLFNRKDNSLRQLGAKKPESSLMFTKFSPTGDQVAYVSRNNIYVEEISSGKSKALTQDGSTTLINGTFDWAYEEEFSCRDGFRWSPNGAMIAYWQVDASEIGNFYMINNTDSNYAELIPVQYPKVGVSPSACRLKTVNVRTGKIIDLKIPGDPKQNYLPRMQWIDDQRILVQQLNRKQNHYRLWIANPMTGEAEMVYEEKSDTWIDIDHPDPTSAFEVFDLNVIEDGQAVLRLSERGDWRQLYRIPLDGGKIQLVTPGEYDIARLYWVAPDGSHAYINASPENPTQRFLHRVDFEQKGKLTRLTPTNLGGIHNYNISPNGRYAIHQYSNVSTPNQTALIEVSEHELVKPLIRNKAYQAKIETLDWPSVEFFQVTTADGVGMDGRMLKPHDFDPAKKYPVLFHVYGEPWGQTAVDRWLSLFDVYLTQQGYVVITMDNRGTPSLKGKEWRKSIYRKIGVVNSRDQAMATKEVLKWSFVDPERVAVWGWSGGGSMTLNLLFRYPEIYKTGMSVAPVANQLYYDNIYQERYMGLPSENEEDFIEGSPITYAKNLRGNLLLVHGTGDDNVHYQNAEALINELILHNKQFQVMPYPNRSHGIREGENTSRHLYTLLSNYLMRHVPAGHKP